MKIIKREYNLNWLPRPNKIITKISSEIPDISLITSVFAFVFHNDGVLLTKNSRGWDIPGGHIDDGEKPEEAIIRETKEETGVDIEIIKSVGYQEITILGIKPNGYRYPFPLSYQLFFIAKVKNIGELDKNYECEERHFFDLEKALNIGWVKENKVFFQSVLNLNL